MVADFADLHRRAAASFGDRVHSVGDDQWRRPTPCEDWDVRSLVHHLVEEELWVPLLVGGLTIEEVGDRFSGDLVGDDPKSAWDAATGPAVAAFFQEGAMDRTVHLSYGDVPGRDYAAELFCDLVVHGWDLARAIGADERLDPELVQACWEVSEPKEAVIRSSGLFGPRVEVPFDAGLEARLLGLYGRRA